MNAEHHTTHDASAESRPVGIAKRMDDETKRELLKTTLASLREVKLARIEAVKLAIPALANLVEICGHKTGQSYTIRSLLFSLWNGKPAQLSGLLGLDWNLKTDICRVMHAFGYEDQQVKFFYTAIADAFAAAGLLEWFKMEGEHHD